MPLIFPRWKYLLLAFAITIGVLYSLPNLFGEDPSVQINGENLEKKDYIVVADRIKQEIDSKNLSYKKIESNSDNILVRFNSTETQLKAMELIKSALGENYSVALNLAPVTPRWLEVLGAEPMKLGLDLRGGVRFLMEVDVNTKLKTEAEGYYSQIRTLLREEKVRYKSITLKSDNTIKLSFNGVNGLKKSDSLIAKKFLDLSVVKQDQDGRFDLLVRLNQAKITQIRKETIENTVIPLRKRVNELGVAEAVVAQQGLNRIVVELPGIQDTARAKDIIGKTATLDFVMVDHENDLQKALQGKTPVGSRILPTNYGGKILVKKKAVLTGDSIIGASSGLDNQDGKPVVHLNIGGEKVALFRNTTLRNIGKQMAIIYRETKMEQSIGADGEVFKTPITTETVISHPRINSALGNNFVITGLSMQEARDLALLLKSGALPATISIVEERIIGPSMGQENIDKGLISVAVGLGLVLFFMAIYYRWFGIIANFALVLNLVFLVAIMSLIGATLTLPGIAGIVLTLGMAVDANVLIFERIREELRLGVTPLASISRGFDHAFATIVDANITTLIVGIILYAIGGSGPVKGFAVTLCIGILTSMFTAVTGTKAFIYMLYNGKNVNKLSIGI